ncbi:hypothetical protein PEC18_18630 [Paucibacter sp. O1-1]|nr:hypothetical protein [Paucibacter sp. O1-1]MDA3827814.1 hypothetical protein [Paucibacter sp. O1-1]
MSAAKRTPGLWSVSKAKHMGGEHVIAVIAGDRGDRSLVVHAPQGDEAQDDANASLIAAAPELIAALEASTHGLHPADSNGPCLCGQCAFVRLRDAAIAKAIGSAA